MPLDLIACKHWADVKKPGRGTRVTPISWVAKSIAIHSKELSASIPTGALGFFLFKRASDTSDVFFKRAALSHDSAPEDRMV